MVVVFLLQTIDHPKKLLVMKNLRNVGLAMIAVSVGMAAHAQQNTQLVSGPAHSLGMYQDTTKKDTTKKDTTKKDTSSFAAADLGVAFYQDTTKKDTTKKDTVKAFSNIAFYQDTTRKDTAKKDTSSLFANSVAVAFYQDTTKKDTTKKDTVKAFSYIAFYQDTTKKDTAKKDTTKKDTTVRFSNMVMNSLRRSEPMVAAEPVNAAKAEGETEVAKKEQPTSV